MGESRKHIAPRDEETTQLGPDAGAAAERPLSAPTSHRKALSSRNRRGVTAALAATLLVFTTFFGVTAWQVWHPEVDGPVKADAIVVLANHKDRRALGRQLAREGYSENLVQSVSQKMREWLDDGTLTTVAPQDTLDVNLGDLGWLDSMELEACDTRFPDYNAYCIYPDPNSTIGEAKTLSGLAGREDWDSVLLVTETSHAYRARGVFERCFPGATHVAVASSNDSVFRPVQRTFYEVLAVWKDRLMGGCG